MFFRGLCTVLVLVVVGATLRLRVGECSDKQCRDQDSFKDLGEALDSVDISKGEQHIEVELLSNLTFKNTFSIDGKNLKASSLTFLAQRPIALILDIKGKIYINGFETVQFRDLILTNTAVKRTDLKTKFKLTQKAIEIRSKIFILRNVTIDKWTSFRDSTVTLFSIKGDFVFEDVRMEQCEKPRLLLAENGGIIRGLEVLNSKLPTSFIRIMQKAMDSLNGDVIFSNVSFVGVTANSSVGSIIGMTKYTSAKTKRFELTNFTLVNSSIWGGLSFLRVLDFEHVVFSGSSFKNIKCQASLITFEVKNTQLRCTAVVSNNIFSQIEFINKPTKNGTSSKVEDGVGDEARMVVIVLRRFDSALQKGNHISAVNFDNKMLRGTKSGIFFADRCYNLAVEDDVMIESNVSYAIFFRTKMIRVVGVTFANNSFAFSAIEVSRFDTFSLLNFNFAVNRISSASAVVLSNEKTRNAIVSVSIQSVNFVSNVLFWEGSASMMSLICLYLAPGVSNVDIVDAGFYYNSLSVSQSMDFETSLEAATALLVRGKDARVVIRKSNFTDNQASNPIAAFFVANVASILSEKLILSDVRMIGNIEFRDLAKEGYVRGGCLSLSVALLSAKDAIFDHNVAEFGGVVFVRNALGRPFYYSFTRSVFIHNRAFNGGVFLIEKIAGLVGSIYLEEALLAHNLARDGATFAVAADKRSLGSFVVMLNNSEVIGVSSVFFDFEVKMRERNTLKVVPDVHLILLNVKITGAKLVLRIHCENVDCLFSMIGSSVTGCKFSHQNDEAPFTFSSTYVNFHNSTIANNILSKSRLIELQGNFNANFSSVIIKGNEVVGTSAKSRNFLIFAEADSKVTGFFRIRDCIFENYLESNATMSALLVQIPHSARASIYLIVSNSSFVGFRGNSGAAISLESEALPKVGIIATFLKTKFRHNNVFHDQFVDVSAAGTYSYTPQGKGGAIYAFNARLRFSGCVFEENSALRGGAIYVGGKAKGMSLVVINTSFIRNSADNGGAIRHKVTKSTFNKTTFDNNFAFHSMPDVLSTADRLILLLAKNEQAHNYFQKCLIPEPRSIKLPIANSSLTAAQLSMMLAGDLSTLKILHNLNEFYVFESGTFSYCRHSSGANLDSVHLLLALIDAQDNLFIEATASMTLSGQHLEELQSEAMKAYEPYRSNPLYYNVQIIGAETGLHQSTQGYFGLDTFQVYSFPGSIARLNVSLNTWLGSGSLMASKSFWYSLDLTFRPCRDGEFVYNDSKKIACAECQHQTYSVHPTRPCKPCPEKHRCEHGRLILSNHTWRRNASYDQIYNCFPVDESPCRGDYPGNRCSLGHTGTLCAVCDRASRFVSDSAFGCVSCDSYPVWKTFILLLVHFALLIYEIYGVISLSQDIIDNTKIELIELQPTNTGLQVDDRLTTHVFSQILFWTRRKRELEGQMGPGLGGPSFLSVRKTLDKTKVLDQTSILLKILMTYIQLFLPIVSVDPETMKHFSFLLTFYGNPFGLMINYLYCEFPQLQPIPLLYMRLGAMILIPLLEILLLVYIFRVGWDRRARLGWIAKLVAASLAVYLSYLPDLFFFLATTLTCFPVHEDSFSKADYEVSCKSPDYMKASIVALVTISLIIIIIPLLIWIKLYRNRTNLELIRGSFGIFINDYKDEFFWWEFVRLSQKLLVLFIHYAFLRHNATVGLLQFIVLTFYYKYTVRYAPYYDQTLNDMDAKMAIALMATSFCMVIYQSNKTLVAVISTTGIIILANIVFLADLVYRIVRFSWPKVTQLFATIFRRRASP